MQPGSAEPWFWAFFNFQLASVVSGRDGGVADMASSSVSSFSPPHPFCPA